MTRVKIQTAQNVEIEYETADVGRRILAALIDSIILFIYIIGCVFLFSYLFAKGILKNEYMLRVIIPAFIPYLLYDLLLEIFMNGQSFGKKIMKIRVVMLDGSQPSLGSYIIRWIFRIVDVTITYGSCALITILINGKGQRLGDMAAGTAVVRVKKSVSLADTIYMSVEDGYTPQFPGVRDLSDTDISLIKEALDFGNVTSGGTSSARRKILVTIMTAIEKKLKTTSRLSERDFLFAVLKDYNHYHGS